MIHQQYLLKKSRFLIFIEIDLDIFRGNEPIQVTSNFSTNFFEPKKCEAY